MQATVREFDAVDGSGSVFLDDGTVRRFGPEVNLSNVPVGEVLALETLRLGLPHDTLGIGGR